MGDSPTARDYPPVPRVQLVISLSALAYHNAEHAQKASCASTRNYHRLHALQAITHLMAQLSAWPVPVAASMALTICHMHVILVRTASSAFLSSETGNRHASLAGIDMTR